MKRRKVPDGTVSGQQTPQQEQPTAAAQTPSEPEMVKLTKAEADGQAAELRKLRAEVRKREEKDAAERAEAERKAAEERGAYDQALTAEQARTKAAEEKAARLAKGAAISDEITRLGYSGEKAAAIRRLASVEGVQLDSNGDADPISTQAAVQQVLDNYPSMFPKAGESAQAGESVSQQNSTPSTPPATPPANPPASSKVPAGYVSPEEYQATPMDVRRTPEFQARVAVSRPRWPNEVPASVFAQEG